MNNNLTMSQNTVQADTARYSYHTIFTRDGEVLSSRHNIECEEVTGYTPEDYQCDPGLWIEMVHRDDRKVVGQFFEELRLSKSSGQIEHRVICKNGSEKWVSNFCMIREMPDSKLQGDGFVIDITERKIGEEERRRLSSIVDSAEDAILSETMEGIITSWNKGAEKIYGYKADEVIGKSISILTPEGYKNEPFEILHKISMGEHISLYHTVRRSKSGDHIHVSLTVSPIIDGYGNITGASLIARDITDLKHAEKALRESEEKLEAILLSSPDIVMVLNGSLIVEELFTAQDHLLWATRENILNLPINSHMPENVADKIIEGVLLSRQSEEPVSIEFSMKIADEQKDFAALSSRMLSDELIENKSILVIRDQSEKKRVERMEEDVERIVKHDLKTPLNGIIGFSQVLLNEDISSHNRKMLEHIYNSGIEMLYMIDHSLDIFKIEEGIYQFTPEDVDLIPVFEKLIDFFINIRKTGNISTNILLNGGEIKDNDSF
ncbi:MAG: PAS domain S-box protein, partial [Spirochaetota bacterium]|nr:PAS domain S-box protein [Spirochaetota bacterium]